MVHMSYVPPTGAGPESSRKYRRDVPIEMVATLVRSLEIRREGLALGPRMWSLRKRLDRRDERGAEMVEFAFVVVLLIALLYGIISYGLVLAAQSTITQAAADGARAGIVASPASGAAAAAEKEASTDVGWMGQGTCGANTVITCVATPEQCPSNASNSCLSVTVTYNYSESPLFPELPGFGVIMPSSLSSTNVLQLSTPTS